MTFVKPCKKTITTQRNMLPQPLTLNRMSQPTHSKILLALICLVSALSLSSVHAEDNTTNIISGALLNNSATNYYVGRTGTNNYLEINSGGVLTNVAQGIIGSNATAIANSALVTGAGSVWYCTGVLTAGNAGSSNSLVIANGGTAKSLVHPPPPPMPTPPPHAYPPMPSVGVHEWRHRQEPGAARHEGGCQHV